VIWKPRPDQCGEQLKCDRFIWKWKAKNEHVRRFESCKKFEIGKGCEDNQGQACDWKKMRRLRGK